MSEPDRITADELAYLQRAASELAQAAAAHQHAMGAQQSYLRYLCSKYGLGASDTIGLEGGVIGRADKGDAPHA